MKKFIKIQKNRGMTYVELIIVLSIFATMTSIVLFNFSDFQAKVDIKNLASDIALKVVEAQKSALSGKLPPLPQQPVATTWKPSYGIYIDRVLDNKSFIYFTDLTAQDQAFDTSSCPGSGECLAKILITRGNIISKIETCTGLNCATSVTIVNPISITFKRPESRAYFKSSGALLNVDYVQITIASPQTPPKATALIKIYASGRIQVN